MPHYLIHVGPHKTGTTYLQFKFHAARRRLLERGVVYPTVWSVSEYEPSHQKLMIGLRDAKLAELEAQFQAMICGDVEIVLVSSEGINLLNQTALDSLKALVGTCETTVIFYCRRWSELLPSLWQETVKHGHDETFPEFVSAHLGHPYDARAINFALALEGYAGVFGRENIKIVSYSNVCDSSADLAEHFFETFMPRQRTALDDLPQLSNARPNRSFSPLETEMIRALNSLHKANGGALSAELRVWFMRRAGTLDLTGLASAIEANIETLELSDASPALARLHGELFEAYGDLMVQPVQTGRLFEPRVGQIRFVQPRYLADRSARAALEKIHAAFLAETGRNQTILPSL